MGFKGAGISVLRDTLAWELILSLLPLFNFQYLYRQQSVRLPVRMGHRCRIPGFRQTHHRPAAFIYPVIEKDGFIQFKHELFRRTIEASLSPLKRIALHRRVLELLRESFEENQQIERIVHHAKNANAYDLVVQYAPVAAKQAASVGAHVEAAKLYASALEYYQGKDKEWLVVLYEAYAYECYLTKLRATATRRSNLQSRPLTH